MPYRKKLIEVALPLEAINREAALEKSIRHGHPRTLHLWWACQPLAACRAVPYDTVNTNLSKHSRVEIIVRQLLCHQRWYREARKYAQGPQEAGLV